MMLAGGPTYSILKLRKISETALYFEERNVFAEHGHAPPLQHRGWKINFHTTYQQTRLIQIRVATEALYFPSILLVHMTHFPLFCGTGHQCIRNKIRIILSYCTLGAVT